MAQENRNEEKETSWKDVFVGAGRKIRHIGQCLKRPAFVGKALKATAATLGVVAVGLLLVAGLVITKGRALPLDLLAIGGIAASGKIMRGVGRLWDDVGDESRKIWNRSFPPHQPAPPMPRILPIGLSFKRTKSAAAGFATSSQPTAQAPDNERQDPAAPRTAGPKMN